MSLRDLSTTGIIIFKNNLKKAIEDLEDKIKCNGALTHRDAKFDDGCKDYFNRQAAQHKADIAVIKNYLDNLTTKE